MTARGAAARDIAVGALAWLLGAVVFFRQQWTSGFNKVMGESGDTRLIVYLNEHWYLVLRGHEAWLDPAFFYPTKGVLGYTDTFFLFQIFYAPLRELGAEPFLAFQLTIVALTALAFASFVVLVRVALRAPIGVAVAGALTFTFANNLFVHPGHPQLYGIYFVPPIALLGLAAWRDLATRPARSALLGGVFGLLTALLLFTTYYVAWLSLLAAGIVLVLTVAVAPALLRQTIGPALRRGWRTVAALAAGFAAGIVPFVLTYLPIVRQMGARHYRDVLVYAPPLRDLMNVTPQNALWGHLLGRATAGEAAYEVNLAVTPILLLAVVAGAVIVVRGRYGASCLTRAARLLPAVLAATAVLLVALPLRFGWGSLWVAAWHLPGATAVRAVGRLEIVNDLVLGLALVVIVTRLVGEPRLGRSRWRPAIVAAVIVLAVVVIEQINTASVSNLRRDREAAFLRSVPPAPAGCRSFFVTDAARPPQPFYVDQIDAMLISQRIGLPTLNGYSGDTPKQWGLWFPADASYHIYVKTWALQQGLGPGLCGLEVATMTWTAAPRL